MSETASSGYWQLPVPCTPATAAAIETSLQQLGAMAVSLTDAADSPILEPPLGSTPLWPTLVVTGMFPDALDQHEIIAQVVSSHPHLQEESLCAMLLKDQVWERAWMDRFKPMQFGERLWVYPHHLHPGSECEVVLRLDPGLAFGTGNHPTTSLCLGWLADHLLPGDSLIDFGCGSGILGIAAALLGAGEIQITDIDPQARIASFDNARRNQVKKKVVWREAEQLLPANVLIANILAEPLLGLVTRFAGLLPAASKLVVSGILSHQQPAILGAYAQHFTDMLSYQQDDWIMIEMRRKDEPA